MAPRALTGLTVVLVSRVMAVADGRSRDRSCAGSGNVPRHAWCHAGGVPLRCLIVDDHASFVKAAAAMLEREGLSVVGVAYNGADALTRTRELHPDVVLLDIALGADSGMAVARRLAEDGSDVPKLASGERTCADSTRSRSPAARCG